jgi:hypothetical protein
LTIGATGAYQTASLAMNAGGSLAATYNVTIQPSGNLSVDTGTITAQYIGNSGSLTTGPGGTLGAVAIGNTGYASLGGAVSTMYGISNDGTLTLGPACQVTTGTTPGLLNSASLTLDGATVMGGDVVNDYGGVMSARGSVYANLTNNGEMDLAGILTVYTGSVTNNGTITIASSRTLRPYGGFDNYGSLVLSGGSVGGAMTNRAGGVISGNGSISGTLVNEGTVAIDDKQTLTVSQPSDNSGLITLGGAKAILSGGSLTNSGTISGQGTLSNSVTNTGTLRAETGVLALGGTSVTNGAGGTIEVLDGATALVSRGLASNAGSIVLRGGTFDNNNRTMTNNGLISGYGTIRTGGLTNAAGKNIGAGSGNLDVIGPVTNDGTITTQAGRTTTFYNAVNGGGTFPGTGAVAFLGGFSPGHSPAIVAFGGDVTLGGANTLTMELAENDNSNSASPRFDELNVAQNVSVGGIMDLVWTPRAGDVASKFGGTYDLITYSGQLDGTFTVQCDFSAYIAGINYAADAGAGLKAVRLTLWPLLAGDANLDGKVTLSDLTALAADFGSASAAWRTGDFDLDGKVTWQDYLLAKANYGRTASGGTVPEPATLTLLCLGAAALLRRQRSRAAA